MTVRLYRRRTIGKQNRTKTTKKKTTKKVKTLAYNKSEYDVRYFKTHVTRKSVIFNEMNAEDKRLLAWVEQQPNFNRYIKELVRRDLTTKLTTK